MRRLIWHYNVHHSERIWIKRDVGLLCKVYCSWLDRRHNMITNDSKGQIVFLSFYCEWYTVAFQRTHALVWTHNKRHPIYSHIICWLTTTHEFNNHRRSNYISYVLSVFLFSNPLINVTISTVVHVPSLQFTWNYIIFMSSPVWSY